MRIVGGYVSGLVGGVVCSLPATLSGEYLAMPLYAAAGVLGGLLRDLAPDPEDVWRFSPFFDLSLWRLARHKENRPRSIYHVGMLLALVAAEFMRYLGLQVFDKQAGLHALPEAVPPGHAGRGSASPLSSPSPCR